MNIPFSATERSLEIKTVSLAVLNAAVQETNTTAKMLVQQHNYLPGVVGAMDDLAISINRTTFNVRKVAQSSISYLEGAARKLKGYQAELDDPEIADEVRGDMETELRQAFKDISAQSEDLKSIQLGISTPYDKVASGRWIASLQQDRADAEQNKANTEQKLIDLQAQMKSVTDAIDSIEKAGIEKIGQEAQLTQDSLAALGMAPPQVQVALLAVDTLKKIISGIGEAISYLNMVAGYNRLRERASELRAQLEKQTRAIAQLDGEIRLVETLDELDAARWAYVKVFSNIVIAYEKFTLDFEQDKSKPVEVRALAVTTKIPDIIDYLSPLRW